MTVARGNSSGDRSPDEGENEQDLASREVLSTIELELAQLLRRAERTTAAGRSRTARTDGPRSGTLDRSAYLLLHDLLVDGAQNVNTLADHLGLDASTVTRQVVAMEKAGLARRTRDPADGRAVLVEATPQGIDELSRHRGLRAELYAEVLADWSRLDRALLGELLERLNDDLDAYKRGGRTAGA
ncbi:MarR family winged helix-turn-helix transcriptional regulator [Oerskovia jenensis]|uniref:DNA-binding MarR family transcriptional regulator n=1 Tax=Oerskovia jenensis TaxID=162169 RepID=A0ABS2LIK6_9CELL|nr:MarR family transcriptional regulator [Oerskovia jenensis]MBM7480264.1 DNA-binding MarR family transcriptional regulator [Oerskovia jenensis]